jgi:hypothetical protein
VQYLVDALFPIPPCPVTIKAASRPKPITGLRMCLGPRLEVQRERIEHLVLVHLYALEDGDFPPQLDGGVEILFQRRGGDEMERAGGRGTASA